MKKTLLSFLAIFFLMMLSLFASGVLSASPSSTVIATDNQNDVYEYSFTNGAQSVKNKQSKPIVDIVSLSYGLDSTNNATIILTLKGTPEPSNTTYYFVSLLSESSNITALMWSGTYSASTSLPKTCSLACVDLIVNNGIALSNASVSISGNSITWTLPREVNIFVFNNSLTSSYYKPVDANLTAVPGKDWSWLVDTLTTTSPLTLGSLPQSGNWWIDTMSWNSTNSTSTSKGLAGFEVVPVLGIFTVTSILAIFEKRGKNQG